MSFDSVGSPWAVAVFTVFVLGLLMLDLGVFHRKAHAVSMKEAGTWTCIWVSLALLFNLFVGLRYGFVVGAEFLAGYALELALSVDNLFVFLVIFSYFAVPAESQHRVLFWGIIGALVTRAGFIFAGTALIQRFEWIFYVFGVVLVLTGVKLLRGGGDEVHPDKNVALRLLRRVVPLSERFDGSRFFTHIDGRRLATPLFAVLVVIEATDIVFAVDSIPAVLSITQRPFIVFTSNIFAILGLRSLFFLLSGIMGKFHYLQTALGLVLGFVGLKMLVHRLVHVHVGVSLAVIVLLIGGSIVMSILRPPPPQVPGAAAGD